MDCEANPNCPDCQGTGIADSGGTEPNGYAIYVRCVCTIMRGLSNAVLSRAKELTSETRNRSLYRARFPDTEASTRLSSMNETELANIEYSDLPANNADLS